MALTKSQKAQLDDFLLNNILNNTKYYDLYYGRPILIITDNRAIKDIEEALNFVSTKASIIASARRLEARGKVFERGGAYFCPKENEDNASIETDFTGLCFRKEKNRLYIENSLNVPVYYDFITKQFVNEPSRFNSQYWRGGVKRRFEEIIDKAPEWIFNYTNKYCVVSNIICTYNRTYGDNGLRALKQPADVHPYLEANNQERFEDSQNFVAYLFDALITRKMKIHPLISLWVVERCNIYKSVELIKLLTDYPKLQNVLNQISKATTSEPKTMLYGADTQIEDFVGQLASSLKHFGEKVFSYLDGNRTFGQNEHTLAEMHDTLKNQLLAEQMQKLNFIHKTTYLDKYIVVVPQTQEDKVEEGTMQNNCVGHYYDDHIINGEDFIYFLRKLDKPAKSYITCRYNVENKQTVEFRGCCNSNVTDKDAIRTIETIDKIITQNLK